MKIYIWPEIIYDKVVVKFYDAFAINMTSIYIMNRTPLSSIIKP